MTPPSLQHSMIEANRLKLHVAEMGEGPAVVLCHGWPETWYSWRHQLPALAAAGFRALAPDMRGYGRSDRPEPIEAYSIEDFLAVQTINAHAAFILCQTLTPLLKMMMLNDALSSNLAMA